MSQQRIDLFIEWLNDQETLKGWTDNKLAIAAGISPSVITRARQGILPKWDACEAIARALGVDPTVVFRKAGLLPPTTPDNEFVESAKTRLDLITDPVLRRMALDQLEAIVKAQTPPARAGKPSTKLSPANGGTHI